MAVRRRGVPPGAILSFVNELGVTTAKTTIQVSRFEQSVRTYLENTVPRLMLILDPIPVIIDDLPEGYVEEIELPFSPKDPKMGSHKVPFTRKIYIDRSDFREIDSKDYFRLAPGKSTDEAPFKKPKTYIQWIADSPKHGSPQVCEVRIFNSLFKSDKPELHEEGLLADINPNSLEVYNHAIIETGLDEIRDRAPWPEEGGEKDLKGREAGWETVRFQGLRVGYFAMDKDSQAGKPVLNRIVSLKEDPGKATVSK